MQVAFSLGSGSCDQRQSGAALVTLLIALTVLAMISVALLSLNSSSLLHQMVINRDQRLYYLAESGYRYAAEEFLHGGDNAAAREAILEGLSGRILTMNQDLGQIQLKVCPYFFKLTSNPRGTGTIRARVPGKFPDEWKLPRSADLFIDETLYRYRSYSRRGEEITFSLEENKLPSIEPGTVVQLACAVDSSTPSKVSGKDEGYIILADGSGAAFPKMNGSFRVSTDPDHKTYGYRSRTGDRLDSIYNIEKPDEPVKLEIESRSRIILQKFIELHSTGYVGPVKSGAVSRELVYFIPIAAAASDQSQVPVGRVLFDKMDSLENWTTKPPGHSWGGFGVDAHEGAIKVTATTGANPSRAAVGYQDFFKKQWLKQGKILSYDAQVKIKAYDAKRSAPLDEFAAGLFFRLDPTGTAAFRSLGVSFLKAGQYRGLPESLIPPQASDGDPESDLYVILWRLQNGDNFQLLAYKRLSVESGLLSRPTTFFADDMEHGTSAWQARGQWGLTRYDYHSPHTCWTDSPGGNYRPDQHMSLLSQRIDLSKVNSAILTFWHRADMEKNHARATVKVSQDDGNSWTKLADYTGSYPWRKETIPVDEKFLTKRFRLRFGFKSDDHKKTRDGWYIDDVKLQTSSSLVDWATLMVRINEKVLNREDESSSKFPAGTRVNDIRIYIAATNKHGSPNGDPVDDNRLGNPRYQGKWPPQNAQDTVAANDFFTLVQWDAAISNKAIQLQGTGKERGAVIRTSHLTTESFADHRPEIGLHGFGDNAAGNLYFDDFSLRLPGSGQDQGVVGFLPPVQQ